MGRWSRRHPDLDGLTITITAVCVVFFLLAVLLAVLHSLSMWHWARP